MIHALRQQHFSEKFKCFSTPIEFRKSKKSQNRFNPMFLHVCEADFWWFLVPETGFSLILRFCTFGNSKIGVATKIWEYFLVRAMAVPMAIHSHWHIHCRSRTDSHSHGHHQSYGGRALGLSHSDCHRRCHGNGVATANDNGRGTGHAVAVAMAKARGLAMILMTFYTISVFSVAAAQIFGKIQMLLNTYRFWWFVRCGNNTFRQNSNAFQHL